MARKKSPGKKHNIHGDIGDLVQELAGQSRDLNKEEWRMVIEELRGRSADPRNIRAASVAIAYACTGPQRGNQDELASMPESMNSLVALLVYPDAKVQTAAAGALAAALEGGHRENQDSLATLPHAVPQLTALLLHPDENMQNRAAKAIAEACRNCHRQNQQSLARAPEAYSSLARLLERGSTEVQSWAAEVIIEACRGNNRDNQDAVSMVPQVISSLVELLEENDTRVLNAAAGAIAEACGGRHVCNQDALFKVPDSARKLARLLYHPDSSVQSCACGALACACEGRHEGNQNALAKVSGAADHLVALLDHQNINVQTWAMISIREACRDGHQGNQDALAAVPDGVRRLASLCSDSNFEPWAVTAIAEACRGGHRQNLDLLARTPLAIKSIARLLKHPNVEVQQSARAILRNSMEDRIGFAGAWNHGTISMDCSTLTWANGLKSSVEVDGAQITLNSQGRAYHGLLQQNGTIRWDHGDDWLRLAEEAQRFAGLWSRGTISPDCSTLTWANGEAASIQVNGNMITLFAQGAMHHGQLNQNGEIVWTDGDVWSRVTEDHLRFAGEWDKAIISMDCTTLTWKNGGTAFVRVDGDKISLFSQDLPQGAAYVGWLLDGQIRWSDGDVWLRDSQAQTGGQQELFALQKSQPNSPSLAASLTGRFLASLPPAPTIGGLAGPTMSPPPLPGSGFTPPPLPGNRPRSPARAGSRSRPGSRPRSGLFSRSSSRGSFGRQDTPPVHRPNVATPSAPARHYTPPPPPGQLPRLPKGMMSPQVTSGPPAAGTGFSPSPPPEFLKSGGAAGGRRSSSEGRAPMAAQNGLDGAPPPLQLPLQLGSRSRPTIKKSMLV